MDDDDLELFRRQMRDVRRLRSDTVVPEREKPRPTPRQRSLDEEAVLLESLLGPDDPDLETGDDLAWARPGLQRSLLRRLRRGQLSVQGTLDLHGMSAQVARLAVSYFIAESRTRGARCVRIVHGKGLGSRHGVPVLKRKLSGWLRKRDDVLAFCSARACDGGTGAAYVLLRGNGRH